MSSFVDEKRRSIPSFSYTLGLILRWMMEVSSRGPLNYPCRCSVDVPLYYWFTFGTNMWPILFCSPENQCLTPTVVPNCAAPQ
jgi:hypothetical protein